MSILIFALGITLMHFLWQGLLIAGATTVVLALLRNSRAEYRYLAACTALLACLAWPLLGLYQRLAGAVPVEGAAFGKLALVTHAAVGAGDINLRDSLGVIVGAWALCAAVLALRIVLGLLWINRAATRDAGRHCADQVRWQARLTRMAHQFGIGRAVRLRIVDTLSSPVTAGWWRPVVLVPAALVTGMPPDLLEALLAHELAHVRRHDYLVNLLQNMIETLLFYHPAVWWLSRRVRAERELIADDFAARQLGEPRRLALALSELERLQFSHHQPALAANGGNLMDRIKHLMRPAPQALNWKAAIPMLGLALACLSIYAEATAAAKVAVKDSEALADFSSCAKPAWPAGAVAAHKTGAVDLSFDVKADGTLGQSSVIHSSGHADLDEAARVGIEKCRFKPAVKDGLPVASQLKVRYVWQLE